jgi:hypothetical protein
MLIGKEISTMKQKYFMLLLLCGILLAACAPSETTEPTPDVAAVRTSAASTVEAKFTLTAAAFTPTPSESTDTPEPEATATETEASAAVITNDEGTPVELCDSLGYDIPTVDVNVPDNTIMSPGQDFRKTWLVTNNGTCPWGAGYVLAYAGYSNQMSGQFIALDEVIQPGQEVEVSVQFEAPTEAGEYLSRPYRCPGRPPRRIQCGQRYPRCGP